jgi:hypothetical protein
MVGYAGSKSMKNAPELAENRSPVCGIFSVAAALVGTVLAYAAFNLEPGIEDDGWFDFVLGPLLAFSSMVVLCCGVLAAMSAWRVEKYRPLQWSGLFLNLLSLFYFLVVV